MSQRPPAHPGAVAPEDLLAFLDGEAPPHIVEHLRTCRECRALAREYARTHGQLRRRLCRFDCPPPQTLGDYELGLLPPEDRTAVAAHVVACPRCGDELRQLRDFLAGDLVTPSPGPAARPVERVRQIVAGLLAPPTGPALAGLRGVADPATLTYTAEDLTIAIDTGFEARRGRADLTGLIYSEDAAESAIGETGAATLVAPDGTARTAEIDDLGNFAFEGIAPGTYRLEVTLGDRLVVIEELRIGA